MNAALRALVEQRLVSSQALDERAAGLVRAAAAGEGRLDRVLEDPEAAPLPEGAATPADTAGAGGAGGEPSGDRGDAGGAYLASVSVEGFRGIGPRAELDLEPAPGLTLVVGRNGSGKSSFAEGLELLLTGDVRRWSDKPKAWSETWQCLHHAEATRLEATFALAGSPEPVTLRTEIPHGASFGDVTGRVEVDAKVRELGWAGGLSSFRPFLAYSELATMFEKLSSLYGALSPVLGLDDIDALGERLGARRLERDRRRKALRDQARQLAASLQRDPRTQELAQAFAKPKLDEIERLFGEAAERAEQAADEQARPAALLRTLAALPIPTAEQLEAARAALREATEAERTAQQTDVGRAAALADLLRRAVDHVGTHPTDDCPVCGTEGAVAGAWREEAERRIADVEQQTRGVREAGARRTAAQRELDRLLAPLQAHDLTLEQAQAARDEAQKELEARQAEWRPIRDAVQAWIDGARRVNVEHEQFVALKAAEQWVKEQGEDLRAARFAPIEEQAKANWERLRHESSVELHAIRLRKSGRSGRADFDVRADGADASALGVMSQGELLSLSVSIFLPRAALPESPFRFSVIDDPVQSMDPAKVEGLARVLAEAARTRQILVFTHDDRLPEAVRRLKLPATVLRVTRQANSRVTVRPSKPPIARYLSDADAVLKSRLEDAEVARRVVPNLCRLAMEATGAQLARRRAVLEGRDPEWVDDELDEARSLAESLAVGFFLDRGRGRDVLGELDARGGQNAVDTYRAVNAGTHAQPMGGVALEDLPRMTERTIRAMLQ